MCLGKVFSRKSPLVVAIACALSFGFSNGITLDAQEDLQPASSATPRIVAHVDENRLAILKGNTRPEARAEFDRGPVASGLPMGDLVLVLRRGPEQQAAFESFLASQQNP